MNQAARYSVQDRIKIAETYRPISRRNQMSKLNDNFGGTFLTGTLQTELKLSASWTNSNMHEVDGIMLKGATAGHGQPEPKITS